MQTVTLYLLYTILTLALATLLTRNKPNSKLQANSTPLLFDNHVTRWTVIQTNKQHLVVLLTHDVWCWDASPNAPSWSLPLLKLGFVYNMHFACYAHKPRVWNHVIAVYSEYKLQHYATAYRNNKSASEKLGLFRFCKFFMYFFSEDIAACSEITF